MCHAGYCRGAKVYVGEGLVGRNPPEIWRGELNLPPDFEKTLFHLHRNSEKWTFYSVKILKCESFLIALPRNSKK